MYNVKCTRRDDVFEFYYMNYHRVLEIIEDFVTSYSVNVVNNKTKDTYTITDEVGMKHFEKVERKNSEVE